MASRISSVRWFQRGPSTFFSASPAGIAWIRPTRSHDSYEDSGYDEEHIYIFDEHGNSGVLTINGYGSRPIHISYDQLIAATYIWETYSDGRIHENPLRDVFGDDGMIREHNYFVS